jgi:cytochrome c oxidase cbb3-type subunit 3
VVFAIVYWILYPAWPIGNTYTKGIMNDITYTTSDGKTKTTHWNTRALFLKDMQEARASQQKYLEQINASTFEQIRSDEKKSAFAYSMAKVLFADNCAACHQAGGNGVVGHYPNLLDDSWLWGGTFSKIQETITNGRHGMMPSFKGRLKNNQISDVAEYVLSLSGNEMNPAAVQRGKAVFTTDGGCIACHGVDAKGKQSLGSANLTDQIWTIANVPAADTVAGKKAAVMKVVTNGHVRTMPVWKERLSPASIKMLAFYVHELGGGK